MGKKKAADAGDEEEGGGGKKKIMIVGGLLAAGAVYNFVLKKPPPEEPMTPEEIAAAAEPVEGEIVPMEEMILNLSGADAGYLKITLAIVLDELTLAADFEAELPIAQDVAVQYLSAQTPEKFTTPEGRQAAKDELSALIKEAYDGEKVVRVLFTSLVMQ
jgi:flagellar basal body-associated protein FliL